MDILAILSKTTVLFALMATGFAAGRTGTLPRNAIKSVSALVVNFSLPALIFHSMQRPFDPDDARMTFTLLAIGFTVYFACILLGFPFVRALGPRSKATGIHHFGIVFSNAAFMGFPVVESLLGKDALFFLSVYNLPFQVLAFSVGILLIRRTSGSETKTDFSRAFLNPNIVSALLGMAFFLTGTAMPPPALEFLGLLGSITTPCAMIVIGATLSATDLRAALKIPAPWIVSVVRLAVVPFLTYVILKALGFSGFPLAIPVIVAAMPVAANSSLLAETNGGDTEAAGVLVALSTLLSVVTIPLIASILSLQGALP